MTGSQANKPARTGLVPNTFLRLMCAGSSVWITTTGNRRLLSDGAFFPEFYSFQDAFAGGCDPDFLGTP